MFLGLCFFPLFILKLHQKSPLKSYLSLFPFMLSSMINAVSTLGYFLPLSLTLSNPFSSCLKDQLSSGFVSNPCGFKFGCSVVSGATTCGSVHAFSSTASICTTSGCWSAAVLNVVGSSKHLLACLSISGASFCYHLLCLELIRKQSFLETDSEHVCDLCPQHVRTILHPVCISQCSICTPQMLGHV